MVIFKKMLAFQLVSTNQKLFSLVSQ